MTQEEIPAALQAAYARLADKVAVLARNDGRRDSVVPGLGFYRHDHPEHALPCVYPMGLALTLQGHKQVRCGTHRCDYGVGQLLFVGADLSALSYVPDGCSGKPCLGLVIELDRSLLARVVAGLPDEPAAPVDTSATRAPMLLLPVDETLLAAVARLVALVDEPALIMHLAPLLQAEIAVRLLMGEHAARLRGLLAAHSPMQKISRSAAWLREHCAEKIPMTTLARMSHMSASSFRRHFAQIMGLSPLQYQKQWRLQQARQLLLGERISVTEAAARVGYESPSQFSRDYRRLFGVPPLKDLSRARS